MDEIGKLLIVFGVALVIIGAAFLLLNKWQGLGHLPGDVVIQFENFSCFFPIVTSIAFSVVLTIILNLLYRIINR